ncbi:MAG: TonB-dependent receptor plug domain-containing protein [Cyclobacteriaceae bacterium]
MKSKLLSSTFVLLLFFCTSMLTVSDSISAKFIRYHDIFPQEKVYLHLSKPHYRLGESIWFKAYLVDGSMHRSKAKSSVVRVELIDPNGKIVSKRVLSTTHSRMSADFNLDISFEPGPYTIRAFTNWMRNFDQEYFYSSTFNVFKGNGLDTFEKKNASVQELEMAFFPEGGDLIVGLESTIAMKAIDRSGKGISVQGVIKNADDEVVVSFETNELGFGKFNLIPQNRMTYTAQVSTSGEEYSYNLPSALENGYGLSIENEYSTEKIKIKLTGVGIDLMNSSILIHQRGAIQFSTGIETSSPSFSIDLDKTELSPGVYHLTVFDQNDQPAVERLFAVNLSMLDVSSTLDKDSVYNSGNSVDLSVAVVDANAKPLTGSVSASVTKENGYYYSKDQNIQNYLLLSSDLKGWVEKASVYFNATAEAHNKLDLLMLTQGWKRFTWNEILSDSLKNINFLLEDSGIVLTGSVFDFYNRSKSREGFVSMSTITSNNSVKVNTDPQGHFQIPGINFPDTTDLLFNAHRVVNKKGKLRDDTFIDIDKEESPDIVDGQLLADLSSTSIDDLLEVADSSEFTLLDEVVIEGGREVNVVKDPFVKAKSLYLNPSIRIVADTVFKKSVGVKNVVGFMRNIPGVAIIGSGPSALIRLQGLGSRKRFNVATVENMAPLFLLDGVPTSETSVNSLNPFDVYYIDILRGPQASLYGTRGSNGVIAIYLRPAELAKTVPRPGSVFLQFPGYYASKKFEFTDIMKSNLAKDPLGITVHWNPSIELKDGKGRLKFDLPSEPGNYFIRLEGLADNGSPIFLEESILVH